MTTIQFMKKAIDKITNDPTSQVTIIFKFLLELVGLALGEFMERLREDLPYFLYLFLFYSLVYSIYSSAL